MKPMSPKNKLQWIGERVLVRSDVVGVRITVRLGIPEVEHPYANWQCPYLIEGLGDDSIHFARSIDSMGAIQNAYRGIRNRLLKSGMPLRLEGADEDFTGFPRDVPWEFGLTFYRKIEKMIETEEQAIFKANEERAAQRAAQRKARRKTAKKP
jgi:hypothetical protein